MPAWGGSAAEPNSGRAVAHARRPAAGAEPGRGGCKMSAQGDCEFLVKRARELVPGDLWAAKAWLITARSLYPADFNIQVSAAAVAHARYRRARSPPPRGLAAALPD